jgi:hypothetical protein
MHTFESKLYTEFGDFQLTKDSLRIYDFDHEKSVVTTISLKNDWYFPFREHADGDESDFMNKFFRSFDTLNPSTDRVGFFVSLEPFEAK